MCFVRQDVENLWVLFIGTSLMSVKDDKSFQFDGKN